MESDAELLARYASSGDEAAFARIAARHGAMVYRACLRLLGDPHEAEDASQAVFTVLVRKAGSLRRGRDLAAWLHGVARNAAHWTLRSRARRARREEEAVMVREAQASEEPGRQAVLEELDLAMAGLPASQRQAVVLRYLEGRSEEEAARIAGCPQGTISQRASRGLARLRKRLARRGCALVGAALVGLLGAEAQAAVPETLLASLGAASKTVAAGKALLCAEGVVKAMMWTKVKTAAAVVCVAVVLGTGGTVAVQQLAAGEPAKTPAPSPDKDGFLPPTGVLLIGSGVSPKFKNPEVEKIEARYKKAGKPSPFPRKYSYPRPEFFYTLVRWREGDNATIENNFKKNIEFMAREIVPYSPGDVYAGCAETREGSHGVGAIWRAEDGPRDRPMTDCLNIHSMKRQAAFLKSKGIKLGLHMGTTRALLRQLPPDADKKDMIIGRIRTGGGSMGLPKGIKTAALKATSPEVIKWMEETFDHLTHEIGLKYAWVDWGTPSAFMAAAKRGSARHGHEIILRSGAGAGCGREELDIYAPCPDIGGAWQYYEQRFHWWFPYVFPMLYKHVCRMGIDDFYINYGNTIDQARFICTMWALGGSGITWTEHNFFETPARKMRAVQRILPVPEVEPLEFKRKGIRSFGFSQTAGGFFYKNSLWLWKQKFESPQERAAALAALKAKFKARSAGLKKVRSVAPRAWALFVSRPFEKWHVVGFFNPAYYDVEKRVFDLKHLSLKEEDYSGWKNWKGDYLAWDFWDQRFLGVFSKQMKLRLGPASCMVVALRHRTGAPQLLSTDRHITQGGDEIEDCNWSAKDGKLTGSFKRGVKGRSFSLFVYVPANYKYTSFTGDVAKVEKCDGPILRVRLKPEAKATFELAFEKTGPTPTLAKPADGKLVQNALAELIPNEGLEIKELLFRKGGPDAGFEKERYGAAGWAKMDWPELWSENWAAEKSENVWIMARLRVPAKCKRHQVEVYLPAAGRRVKRTRAYLNGAKCHVKRVIILDPEAIKYGAENTLVLYGSRALARQVGLKIDRRSPLRQRGE